MTYNPNVSQYPDEPRDLPMSNPQTSDLELRPMSDLEQSLQELRPEEAAEACGGMQLRPKRAEVDPIVAPTESLSLNFTKTDY